MKMTEQVTKKTTWLPKESLIITEIKGALSIKDIEEWESSLNSTLNELPDNTRFRIFVDMFGFAPMDVEVHKRFREIIPLTLAKYGWKVGYLNMFKEADNLLLNRERGISCVKAAHAHQDSYKIEEYDRRFGSETEHFFTDSNKALAWLRENSA